MPDRIADAEPSLGSSRAKRDRERRRCESDQRERQSHPLRHITKGRIYAALCNMPDRIADAEPSLGSSRAKRDRCGHPHLINPTN